MIAIWYRIMGVNTDMETENISIEVFWSQDFSVKIKVTIGFIRQLFCQYFSIVHVFLCKFCKTNSFVSLQVHFWLCIKFSCKFALCKFVMKCSWEQTLLFTPTCNSKSQNMIVVWYFWIFWVREGCSVTRYLARLNQENQSFDFFQEKN